jgi:hypothetical protein
MRKYLFLGILSSVLIGCGGGGDSKSAPTIVGTAYYIDSAVEGVHYECGIKSGETDANGMFKFEVGKDCIFSINGLEFKKISNLKREDHQKEFKETNQNIAMFLMTLDRDGDPQNGITITKEIAEKVDRIAVDESDIGRLYQRLKTIESYNGRAFDKNEAKAHLKGRLIQPYISITPGSDIFEGDEVRFDASSSEGEIRSYRWTEGDELLSESESFSKSDFSIGKHTITLTIEDDKGLKRSLSKSFEVKNRPSIWTNRDPIATNSDTKLYVASDEESLYIKVESNSTSVLNSSQILIDADGSRRSGYPSGFWEDMGFDLIVRSDGIYHINRSFDDTMKSISTAQRVIDDNSYEVSIPKSKILEFNSLAKEIKLSLFMGDSNGNLPPKGASSAKFVDPHYLQTDDIYPPVIDIENRFIVASESNYSSPSLPLAFDVEDNSDVNVEIVKDSVDKTKEGFYEIIYSAKDSSGNEANGSIVVQISGDPSKSTLEEKRLGVLKESVIIDHQSGLAWANDDTLMKEGMNKTRGCLFIGSGTSKEDAVKIVENYCRESTYAGLKWRAPTPMELSKYTVRMLQEGRIPGMGKKGCVQLVGVENGSIKAVWTHNKHPNTPNPYPQGPYAGYIESDFGFPAGARCVSDNGKSDNSTGGFEIKNGGLNGAKTLIYTTKDGKKLEWVNEFYANNKACLAIHANKPEEMNASKNFCENLNYGGFDDWRDPTSKELQEFVLETNKAHIYVGYEAPCGRLLARDNDGNATVDKYVVTRYGAKPFKSGSNKTVGDIFTLESPLKKNIGLRCVREAD